jgi:uncharacterized damage-inducible protein DinB
MQKKAQLLKFMLEDIRRVTLDGIKDLTAKQLFQQPMEGEFPVGAYLMHLGECEAGWYHTMTGTPLPDDLKKRVYYGAWFDVPPEEYNPPISVIPPQEYLSALAEVRKYIINYLNNTTDEDFDKEVTWKRNGKDITRTKEWIIYHLIEHEAHTRGQMFLLIRKGLKGKKALA